MPNTLATLRRELDMARSDLVNHARIISDFTERFEAIAAWQARKDVEDARAEEREKVVVARLGTISKIGWAILGVLISGFGLAFVTFIINGGLRVSG